MLSDINRQPSMFLGGWITVLAVPTILLAMVGWGLSFYIEPQVRPRPGMIDFQGNPRDKKQALHDTAREIKDLFTSDRLFPTLIGGLTGFFIGVAVLNSVGQHSRRHRRRRRSTRHRHA